jgi:hypothetical protein
MDKLLALAAGAAVFLAGCKTQPPVEPEMRSGYVGATVVETENTEHYEIKSDSYYDYPVQAQSNAMPVYPDELLAARLPPVRVKVRVIVSEAGFVSQCSPIDPAGAVDPRFVAAIQDVVRGWRYMPLVLIKRGPAKTSIIAHGNKTTYEGTATALPFHEDYEFTFRQSDGKGSASMWEPASVAPPD